MAYVTKYGCRFDASRDPLEWEFDCIRQGGRWKHPKTGEECGDGLFNHLMTARKLIWPHRYRHRWTDLMYENFIENDVTILMGCGSSGKTSCAAEYALVRYWSSPDDTLVILSTTTLQKLQMAIFGEIKMLWEEGKSRYDWLAGNPVEYKHAIATDDVQDGNLRDLRRGIIGIACYVGRQFVGLASYSGIKQRNIVFVADELQFCPPTFLACLPNMFQNPYVKVIGSGNPKHDAYDQLGQAAEPIGGWSSLGEITKTTRWPIKFHKGYCINLVGTDSPNFDVPENAPIPFPRLINRNTIARVEARWPKGSLEWCKQCSGVMQIGLVGNRVITRQICDAHHAFDLAVWKDEHRTRIGYLDPAWGGINADRCVWGWLEFGEDSTGVHIIRLNEPIVIPVMAGTSVPPEDQIALAVHQESKRLNIPVENIFYDSTGKGTLGYAFARVFGNSTPVPIAFDGKASTRPVRHDLFVIDRAKNIRRLKTCYEHYSKFVTELWFSVRYVVECDQMREMPESALSEFCMREYYEVSGDRIEVEPKDDTRERMGESPDLADAVAVGVEGARQRGFKIKRLGATAQDDGSNGFDWLKERARKHEALVRSKHLEYA